MRLRNIFCLCAASVILAGCGTKPIQPSDKHIQRQADQPASTAIPQPIKHSVTLPPPKPAIKAETYSVVVTNVPAQEILFALARDAKINLDIHSGIQGTVTLNALNQTLPQILTRIARQVDMRYELDNGNLTVMPDAPYLHHYKIDYVNMTRDADGGISNTTQVGSGAVGGTGAPTGGSGNNASLSIKNTSKNHFWETLEKNIKDILRETDKEIIIGRRTSASNQQASVAGAADIDSDTTKSKHASQVTSQAAGNASGNNSAESDFKDYQTLFAASVISNPENGIITVRATGKQHEKIQEFLDKIMTSARRQVLIEATVVEVRLDDQYQQGIDWSGLRLGSRGINVTQAATEFASGGLRAPMIGSMLDLNYNNPTANGNFSAQIKLLESFGTVKVLSSPKLSVMNNQTAMLRVVDNLVYFTINATVTPGNLNTNALVTYSTTPNTVPVGFTMSVTPQINDSDTVLLNLRPSISRLLDYTKDPNPNLANPCGIGVPDCKIPSVVSLIPQIQTREMESMLKIENNQIAVMGGLMEDRINNSTDAIPGLSDIPGAGNLFKNRNDTTTKTELVIFLRPMVIKDASIDGDFSAYRGMLPDTNFFKEPETGKP